jgi:predicted AlkP superfamily pyrophosphatase or phosphodiesterase
MKALKRVLTATALATSLCSLAMQSTSALADNVKHVLLISIDGMHALDFINCANGIAGANGGAPYCPNLASLKATGVDYLDASTSKPSDRFPDSWPS